MSAQQLLPHRLKNLNPSYQSYPKKNRTAYPGRCVKTVIFTHLVHSIPNWSHTLTESLTSSAPLRLTMSAKVFQNKKTKKNTPLRLTMSAKVFQNQKTKKNKKTHSNPPDLLHPMGLVFLFFFVFSRFLLLLVESLKKTKKKKTKKNTPQPPQSLSIPWVCFFLFFLFLFSRGFCYFWWKASKNKSSSIFLLSHPQFSASTTTLWTHLEKHLSLPISVATFAIQGPLPCRVIFCAHAILRWQYVPYGCDCSNGTFNSSRVSVLMNLAKPIFKKYLLKTPCLLATQNFLTLMQLHVA